MNLIVAGTVRLPPDNLDRFRPHMIEMMTATRAEDGCIDYAYAEDVGQPGLIRVFEIWRDQAALDAHLVTPHIGGWRALWPRFQVSDRRLMAYEIAAERAI